MLKTVSKTKINRVALAAIAVFSFSTLPALAGMTPRIDQAASYNKTCSSPAATASTWNMSQIERSFKAMPQSTRMNMQHVLRHAGLYSGPDDGIWGAGTYCGLSAVAGRFEGSMEAADIIHFFEYMLDEGFTSEYPGTPNAVPHRGKLY